MSRARRSDLLLRDLLRPAHPSVWVMRGGQEVELSADEVVVGDTVIGASGAVLPVDGHVLSGIATVNEAPLTGEATLVEKTRGSHVLSGTLVQEGRIAIYAENVGTGTVSARIAEYVERSLAASVEEHYAFHPLAMAVVEAARTTGQDRHFDHQEVEFIVAHGVASSIGGNRIVVGSCHFVEEDEGIDCSAYRPIIDPLFDEGKTLLFVGFGGRLLGILGLEDTLRPSAAASIARLRQHGVKRILLLTGDREHRTAGICEALGLDGFHADLLPEDKARIVEELSETGARIAFVGDGINDAPALAESHVGIAMHRGADIARMTADIVLLQDDLDGIVEAVAISREVMEIIRLSFGLTIGLNTSILLGASLGWLSPLATSLLHNGSTIAILLNVLRQRIGNRVPANEPDFPILPLPAARR